MVTMTTLTKNMSQGGKAAVAGVVMVVAVVMIVVLVAVGMLVAGVALMLMVAVMALLVTVLVAVVEVTVTHGMHPPLPGLRTGLLSAALTPSPLLSVPAANPAMGCVLDVPMKTW